MCKKVWAYLRLFYVIYLSIVAAEGCVLYKIPKSESESLPRGKYWGSGNVVVVREQR